MTSSVLTVSFQYSVVYSFSTPKILVKWYPQFISSVFDIVSPDTERRTMSKAIFIAIRS